MDPALPAACTRNIGPRGKRVRGLLGLLSLIFSFFFGMVLVQAGVPVPWRGLVFVPLFFGFLGVLQTLSGTCVGLAARHVRDRDAPAVPAGVDDAAVEAAIARRSRRLLLGAFALAAFGTFLFLALPGSSGSLFLSSPSAPPAASAPPASSAH